jgi:hypothetical protein
MVLRSLADLEAVIRRSWSAQTCDPADRADWSAANPALGQCGTTALVLQDLLGGELLTAEVHHADGSRQGHHYWNRLAGGVEVDLTREQFRDGETIGPARVLARPPDLSDARVRVEYETLAAAVRRALGPRAPRRA